MKKFVLFLLFLIISFGVYLIFFKKAPPPEIIIEEKIETPKIEKIVPIKQKVIPITRPYLGPDFKPIDPPESELHIENKESSEIVSLVAKQFINPEVPEMKVDIDNQGTYILIKSGVARFVVQVSVTITTPDSSPHNFNAFADAETGEIIQTVGTSEPTDTSSEPMESYEPVPNDQDTYQEPIESPPMDPPPSEDYNDYSIDDM